MNTRRSWLLTLAAFALACGCNSPDGAAPVETDGASRLEIVDLEGNTQSVNVESVVIMEDSVRYQLVINDKTRCDLLIDSAGGEGSVNVLGADGEKIATLRTRSDGAAVLEDKLGRSYDLSDLRISSSAELAKNFDPAMLALLNRRLLSQLPRPSMSSLTQKKYGGADYKTSSSSSSLSIGECDFDYQCFPEICQNHRCEPGCRGDYNCGSGKICISGKCTDGCRSDFDCTSGKICRNNQCEYECTSDYQCGHGEICDVHSCKEGCRFDSGCDQGEICEFGTCQEGCRSNYQCGPGQECKNKECVDVCTFDSQCSFDEVCQNGECQEGCRDDRDCRIWGQICRYPCSGLGDCHMLSGCSTGCRSDSQCLSGFCVGTYCRECRTDANCGDGVCLYNSCVDCRTTADCGDKQVCRNNQCIDVECTTNADCDDGRWCSGTERCVAGLCRRGSVPCPRKLYACIESWKECVPLDIPGGARRDPDKQPSM